jgi:hypothetical protein
MVHAQYGGLAVESGGEVFMGMVSLQHTDTDKYIHNTHSTINTNKINTKQ